MLSFGFNILKILHSALILYLTLQVVTAVKEQECIPVGCVPPAAVAVCWGGVCLSACWDNSLGVGLETALGVGLETPQVWAWRHPPKPDPSMFPWVWAWRPARHAGIPPPWRPARHAGIPPAMHAGIPPPYVNRITDTCKNITLSQLRCGR